MSSPLCHELPPAGRESPWNLQHPCRLGACPASGHLPVSPVLLRPDPSAPPPEQPDPPPLAWPAIGRRRTERSARSSAAWATQLARPSSPAKPPFISYS